MNTILGVVSLLAGIAGVCGICIIFRNNSLKERIRECRDNEQIQLLYVEKINKIYWAEDKSNEWFVCILLLIVFCCFMFGLTCVLWILV